MDYAVKEMKKFNPESYAIERRILSLANSTWNHFLSALCGDFRYKVCENRIPLDHLAKLYSYSRVLTKKPGSNLSLTTVSLCMLYLPLPFPPTTPSGDRSEICLQSSPGRGREGG